MYLTRLKVHNFRILSQVEMVPGPGLNRISGPNGSGKTSLLESVYYLSAARAFRSRNFSDLVSRGEPGFFLSAELADGSGTHRCIGIGRDVRFTRVTVDGQVQRSTSALARELPLMYVGADSQRLLEEGAESRRRLFDWLLFHVEPRFLSVYTRFRKVLQQRNAALKAGVGDRQLDTWDEEFAAKGEALAGLRQGHAQVLLPDMMAWIHRLLSIPVELDYRPGWSGEEGLAQTLRVQRANDRRRGFSGIGPQRADLACRVEGQNARRILSRGEAKLLIMGLHLAQVARLFAVTGRRTTVAVDDPASELDTGGRRRLSEALSALAMQTFVTGVEPDDPAFETWPGRKRFHVEQGQVREWYD